MYRILQGWNGKWYAVFANEYEADLAEFAFGECPRACFGQYDNAYQLS